MKQNCKIDDCFRTSLVDPVSKIFVVHSTFLIHIFFVLFFLEPDRQTEAVLHRFGSDGHDHCRLPA